MIPRIFDRDPLGTGVLPVAGLARMTARRRARSFRPVGAERPRRDFIPVLAFLAFVLVTLLAALTRPAPRPGSP